MASAFSNTWLAAEDRLKQAITCKQVAAKRTALALLRRSVLGEFEPNIRDMLARRRRHEPPEKPYVAGETRLGWDIWRPALLGIFSSIAIVIGASLPTSPYTLKLPGSWYFGIPAPPPVTGAIQVPGQELFIGVVAVYGGIILLLRAWYDMVKLASRTPGMPVSRLVPIFVAWMIPMLIVAPLFSRDLYSYAAQAEMVSHHISPYQYGTAVLGQGQFVKEVDPLWQYVPSPYGTVFLASAAGIVEATGHNMLATVEGLRFLAVLGTAMFAAAVPVIARSFGRDPAVSFALAALNPLIILHLIGGGHNDALMLGLLAVGYALSRRGHPVLGALVCGVGAAVKIPAMIGALYIGWDWYGPRRSVKQRILPVLCAVGLAFGVLAGSSLFDGLGWGWIAGLSNPDAVHSWLDPATGLALLVARIVTLLGLGNHATVLMAIARDLGLLLAAALSVRLLLRSDDLGPLRALGWSLLIVVILGPAVQPWYASWGFVFLAPIAVGGVRRAIVILSGMACYVGLPGGRVLLNELALANPVLIGVSSLALLGLLVVVVGPQMTRKVAGKPVVVPGLSIDTEFDELKRDGAVV